MPLEVLISTEGESGAFVEGACELLNWLRSLATFRFGDGGVRLLQRSFGACCGIVHCVVFMCGYLLIPDLWMRIGQIGPWKEVNVERRPHVMLKVLIIIGLTESPN
jgi:hypothetical protein